ncbi:hypothetical protein PHMEG_0001431 [Phytophthora megakarya]|uniref:Jacalin-type lectin domain-containing protein n=1 Tax=Phytophthora megakarya TaxID=4795 RepID=A0A225X380_9STRA|nr:hypothetical protein PHMEG_0001431 [Phytophthora megakarya]
MPHLSVFQVALFLVAVVTCLALEISAEETEDTAAIEDIQLSVAHGGPHGNAFSDMSGVTLGQTLSSITVRGDARIDAISTHVATPAEATWDHGGSGGKATTLTLAANEYINSMEIHWGKKGSHTRVFYLKFNTSDGDTVSAGTKTANKATLKAPEGFQLSGFYGRAAGEVDQLGVIWTRRSAKAKKLKDTMGTGWYGKKIRNWVGPTIGTATDTACYRQMEPFNSSNVCPAGYVKYSDMECVAECPLSYPVNCFLECIPQNDDCALEILQKAAAVVASVVNVATAGILGSVITVYQSLRREFFCAANVVGVVRSLIYFLRFQQTTAPQGGVEQLLAVAYQSDVVLVDLPVAICHCLGLHVPPTLVFTGVVMMIVETIVKQAIVNGDLILSSAQNVVYLLENTKLMNSTRSNVVKLQELMDSNSTCGYQLKRLTDHVILSVNLFRSKNPSLTIKDIRVKVSTSPLVLKEIPEATNNCMNELLAIKTKQAAFQTRDLLRKTFGVIVEQLITTATTNKGAFVAETQYMLEVTNMGLTMFSGLDPTRIVWLASQFVQPTCGPTAFIGEIDDGSLYDALGLTTIDEAFVGSYGIWSRKGDGAVNLIFMSTDTKDVKVVIHSGGQTIAKVKVNSGQEVTWNSTVSELEDKVLYLDRWRPNFIGIPGSGGGSLKLWVPRASQGGHLTMHVRINVS